MKDDYLWDGAGESDPEIERLEGLLGRYRSERPAPELPAATVVPFRPRRGAALLPYAAAAAVAIVTLSVGIWVVGHRSTTSTVAQAPATNGIPAPPPPTTDVNGGGKSGESATIPSPAPPTAAPAPRAHAVRHSAAKGPTIVPVEPAEPATYKPLVDVATADHIQQAELLLRSFRNASADDADSLVEVAFDAKQSRDLLDQNELLRSAAAGKKNLPVGQLLGDLEPYLLDIANLGDRPTTDDVREIQQRIDRHDVLSDLELYSSNRTAQGF